MITLRNFNPSDLSEVMLMVTENFNEDYHPGFYLSMHSLWPTGFIVARRDYEIIGFLLGSLGENDEAKILIMVVKEGDRFQGAGTALLQEFITRCSMIGLRRLSLELRVSNLAAFKFYTRFGFQRVTVIEKFYLDGEDAFQLVKWL